MPPLTKLRKTLLVNNIANHFAHEEPLRPWVKEWIRDWGYVPYGYTENPNYVVPWLFVSGQAHLNILSHYNYWWKNQFKPFVSDHENLINNWIDSVGVIDRINKVLKIKSFHAHYQIEDKDWYGKIHCRKYRLTIFGRDLADVMRQIKSNCGNVKNRVLKIERIREGKLIGKLMVLQSHIEIPYMREKIFSKSS